MMQPVQAMSDRDLLAAMVGTVTAARMLESGSSIRDLLEDAVPVRHVCRRRLFRLQVAKEMVRRALLEAMRHREVLGTPDRVRNFLRLTLEGLQHEVFWMVFLDAQNRVIAAEEMFRGTLTQTSVYPREVVKRCLFHNTAAVILAHNHPSGVAEPSRSDELLTQALKQSLALVDVKVLDHFVIASGVAMSFAERGLL
jgi:DNA repair protein RadC